MIKNIVFDIGNVLVDFRWRELMEELHMSKEVQDRFETYVFGSHWWHEFDHGTMEEQDILQHFRQENAEYKEAFELLWKNREYLVEAYEYAVPWIRNLKERGYLVYLLSNYPKKLFTMHAEAGRFPFLDLVDGKVVSAFVKMIKPEPDIYEHLMEKYHLKPEECVFIDDREENIQGAEKVGMKGIVLKDYQQAQKELERLFDENKES